MTDDEFLIAFHSGSIANNEFRHRDHLRLAWIQVRQLGADGAADSVAQGIRHFASHHGHAPKYHDTMTRFWVRLVVHLVGSRPDIRSFESFLEAFPWVLNKTLPEKHWRHETLFSPEARAAWVEPDVLPMPT